MDFKIKLLIYNLNGNLLEKFNFNFFIDFILKINSS